jgi:hypothetical protein
LKEQLDRMVEKTFKHLNASDAMRFGAVNVVDKIQHAWRSRVRARKLQTMRDWRHGRSSAPEYQTVMEVGDVMSEAYSALKQVCGDNSSTVTSVLYQSNTTESWVKHKLRSWLNTVIVTCDHTHAILAGGAREAPTATVLSTVHVPLGFSARATSQRL